MSGRGARHHYAHSCIQKLTHAGDDGGTSEQAYFERNTSEMIVGEDPIFRSRGDDPWQLKKDSPCVVSGGWYGAESDLGRRNSAQLPDPRGGEDEGARELVPDCRLVASDPLGNVGEWPKIMKPVDTPLREAGSFWYN